jgi:hypothetical protein
LVVPVRIESSFILRQNRRGSLGSALWPIKKHLRPPCVDQGCFAREGSPGEARTPYVATSLSPTLRHCCFLQALPKCSQHNGFAESSQLTIPGRVSGRSLFRPAHLLWAQVRCYPDRSTDRNSCRLRLASSFSCPHVQGGRSRTPDQISPARLMPLPL